jgi:hypothetical protein
MTKRKRLYLTYPKIYHGIRYKPLPNLDYGEK